MVLCTGCASAIAEMTISLQLPISETAARNHADVSMQKVPCGMLGLRILRDGNISAVCTADLIIITQRAVAGAVTANCGAEHWNDRMILYGGFLNKG